MDNNETKLNSSPIGFFDSGVGGLSVYSVFRKLLPNENTIYYGDLKNMPYGNKTKEELTGYAKKILNFMASKEVKAVVIACNTSSATVYDIIKNEYNFKIYPIIQSCAKVISSYDVDTIGVFATSATIKSGAYAREIEKYNPNIKVAGIACPRWTNFVESSLTDSEECIEDIKNKYNEIAAFNPRKIILGCTHYPYLLHNLTKFAPEEMFIDPAKIFVDYIKKDLSQNNLVNHSKNIGTEEFFVSANPKEFKKNAKLFYELKNIPALID